VSANSSLAKISITELSTMTVRLSVTVLAPTWGQSLR